MLSACWQIVPQMLNRTAGCPETTLLLFKDKQQRTPRGGQIECAVAILMPHTANTHFSHAFLCVFPGPVGRAWMHGLLQSHKVPDVVWLQSQFSFSLRLRHSTQQSTVDHSALSWWAAASCFSGVCSVANGELVLNKKAGWGIVRTKNNHQQNNFLRGWRWSHCTLHQFVAATFLKVHENLPSWTNL